MCKLDNANKLYKQMVKWTDQLNKGELTNKDAQVRYNLAKGMTKLQVTKLEQKKMEGADTGTKFFAVD